MLNYSLQRAHQKGLNRKETQRSESKRKKTGCLQVMGKEKYQIRVEERRLLHFSLNWCFQGIYMQCYVSLCRLTGPFYLIIPHPEKCGTGDASKDAGPKKIYLMSSVWFKNILKKPVLFLRTQLYVLYLP